MDLLNLDDQKFSQAPRESFIDPDLYTIDPAKGQQGTYKAVGRFLPWHKAPNDSKLRKNMAMLTNPLSKDRLVIDCPSSINKPSILWALDKMLKDRENNKVDLDMVKEIREYFSRFLNFYSPFYIFKDPQVPALENQIKILNFGITFDKLIQKELNPEDAELNPNAVKVNPYSLTAGKDFLIVVKKKSKKFKDYEGCKFIPDIVPFRFNIGSEKHVVTVEELQKTAKGELTPISKFLTENTPNLEKYAYREWTDDTYKQVGMYIKAIVPYQSLMRELVDNLRDEKMKGIMLDLISGNYGGSSAHSTMSENSIASAMTSGSGVDLTMQQPEQPEQKPAPKPEPQPEQKPAPKPEPQPEPAAKSESAPKPEPQPEQKTQKPLDENEEFERMLKGL